MFGAHLIFGDVDGSSKHPFEKRVKIIKQFQDICWDHQPDELNSHSFFSVDNDSLMIGFCGQERLISGDEVLKYVERLHNDLAMNGISVSFGVHLLPVYHAIPSPFGGFDSKRTDMIYMPDDHFQANGRIIRRLLVGDPLIIADRLLRISKKSGKKICFAFNNHNKTYDPSIYNIEYSKLLGWEDLISEDYKKFLHENGIKEVFHL